MALVWIPKGANSAAALASFARTLRPSSWISAFSFSTSATVGILKERAAKRVRRSHSSRASWKSSAVRSNSGEASDFVASARTGFVVAVIAWINGVVSVLQASVARLLEFNFALARVSSCTVAKRFAFSVIWAMYFLPSSVAMRLSSSFCARAALRRSTALRAAVSVSFWLAASTAFFSDRIAMLKASVMLLLAIDPLRPSDERVLRLGHFRKLDVGEPAGRHGQGDNDAEGAGEFGLDSQAHVLFRVRFE